MAFTHDKKFKVADFSQSLDEESVEALGRIADVKLLSDFSSETMESETKDVNAIILSSNGLVSEKIISNVKDLKVVGRIGAGYSNVDIDAATKRSVAVVYSGTANSDTVAELTFGLILAVSRNISWADRAFKTTQDTKWDIGSGLKFMGTDVCNKTLGIIGFGKIGSRVARMGGKGFNMKILVYDPYINEESLKEFNGKSVDLRTLLKESDFVSIHTPTTEQTKGLIGEDEFKIMKDGAYLINAASGWGIVDEDALYKALKDVKLAGAGFDCPQVPVGETTFNPQKPLYRLNNVVMTPMLGARTRECGPRMVRAAVEDVIRVLNGERPVSIVNPSAMKE